MTEGTSLQTFRWQRWLDFRW